MPRPGHPALYAALPGAPARYADWLGRDVVFGVRPEHISALHAGEAPAPGGTALDCRIDVVEPTGTDTMVFFELGPVQMVARIDPHIPVRPRGDAAPGDRRHARQPVRCADRGEDLSAGPAWHFRETARSCTGALTCTH